MLDTIVLFAVWKSGTDLFLSFDLNQSITTAHFSKVPTLYTSVEQAEEAHFFVTMDAEDRAEYHEGGYDDLMIVTVNFV